MTEHTATEEVSLYDVWCLLTEATNKLEKLYTVLEIDKEPLPEKSLAPTTQHVTDHPFFGMTASMPESVSETMKRLRGNRYAL